MKDPFIDQRYVSLVKTRSAPFVVIITRDPERVFYKVISAIKASGPEGSSLKIIGLPVEIDDTTINGVDVETAESIDGSLMAELADPGRFVLSFGVNLISQRAILEYEFLGRGQASSGFLGTAFIVLPEYKVPEYARGHVVVLEDMYPTREELRALGVPGYVPAAITHEIEMALGGLGINFMRKQQISNLSSVLTIVEDPPPFKIIGADFLRWHVEATATGSGHSHGVLLIGPPGTGKTLFGHSLARKYRVVELNLARVFQSLVGESERTLDDALAAIETLARGERESGRVLILMIDEVGYQMTMSELVTDSGVTRRVIGNLLRWLSNAREKGVYVLGTSNQVPDSALVRRMGISFYMGPPPPKVLLRIANYYASEVYSLDLREEEVQEHLQYMLDLSKNTVPDDVRQYFSLLKDYGDPHTVRLVYKPLELRSPNFREIMRDTRKLASASIYDMAEAIGEEEGNE